MATVPHILSGTTVTFGGVLLPRVYSIDGPDLAFEQVDTTVISSKVAATDPVIGASGDPMREFTSGLLSCGPITIEADLEDKSLPKTGALVIVFANGETYTWGSTCNLANMTVAPGSAPDAMRMNIVIQCNDLPVVT